MANILVNSDFVGKYELSKTRFNTTLIDSYIEKYEKQYLMRLLGIELYDLFMTELNTNNPPTTLIYENIYNPISYDYNGLMVSNGMKEMLLGFIYYEYIKDSQIQQTPNGTASASNENAKAVDLNSLILSRYNDSVDSYKTIQDYITLNRIDYPTYKGYELRYNYLF